MSLRRTKLEPVTQKPVEPIAVAQKAPLVIPATLAKRTGMTPPPARKPVIQIATLTALAIVLFTTLASVLPLNSQGSAFSQFQATFSGSVAKKQDTALIASQAATATAILQPGYEYKGAGGLHKDELPFINFNVTPTPVKTLPSTSDGTLSHGNDAYNNIYTPGQCTDWAYQRFYQLHGWHIPWLGNAGEWDNGAYAYAASGWIVGYQPRLHSIIVVEAGVQHAGPVGHVGIVERINADGTVWTSNFNIYAPGQYTERSYTPGPGISFVWHK